MACFGLMLVGRQIRHESRSPPHPCWAKFWFAAVLCPIVIGWSANLPLLFSDGNFRMRRHSGATYLLVGVGSTMPPLPSGPAHSVAGRRTAFSGRREALLLPRKVFRGRRDPSALQRS